MWPLRSPGEHISGTDPVQSPMSLSSPFREGAKLCFPFPGDVHSQQDSFVCFQELPKAGRLTRLPRVLEKGLQGTDPEKQGGGPRVSRAGSGKRSGLWEVDQVKGHTGLDGEHLGSPFSVILGGGEDPL